MTEEINLKTPTLELFPKRLPLDGNPSVVFVCVCVVDTIIYQTGQEEIIRVGFLKRIIKHTERTEGGRKFDNENDIILSSFRAAVVCALLLLLFFLM